MTAKLLHTAHKPKTRGRREGNFSRVFEQLSVLQLKCIRLQYTFELQCNVMFRAMIKVEFQIKRKGEFSSFRLCTLTCFSSFCNLTKSFFVSTSFSAETLQKKSFLMLIFQPNDFL